MLYVFLQEVQILEENLDNSLIHEENALDDAPPGDATSLQRSMKDQKVKFEVGSCRVRRRRNLCDKPRSTTLLL